jgi:hypothetical protein
MLYAVCCMLYAICLYAVCCMLCAVCYMLVCCMHRAYAYDVVRSSYAYMHICIYTYMHIYIYAYIHICTKAPYSKGKVYIMTYDNTEQFCTYGIRNTEYGIGSMHCFHVVCRIFTGLCSFVRTEYRSRLLFKPLHMFGTGNFE